MKKKYIYIVFIMFFALICATLYISTNYYVSTTFKKISKTNLEVARVSALTTDSTYLELKDSIKTKYNKKLISELDVISKEYKEEIIKILGDEYDSLTNKLTLNTQIIQTKSKEFLNSKEYLDKKREMAELKLKMDKAEGEEYDKLYSDFQSVLNEISTLNVKLNNQLKDIRSSNNQIKSELKKLFDDNKDKIVALRTEYKNKVSTLILNIINEYNFELYELSDTFNVKLPKIREFPFDIENFNFKCVSSSYEAEYFNEPIVESADSSTKIEFVDVNYKEIN